MIHRLLTIVAGCCLLGFQTVSAQSTPPPFAMAKEYSAEMVITTKDGMTMKTKTYASDGKSRSEVNTQGMDMVTIIRPDLKKMYQVMVAQKMVMEMPLDLSKQQMSPMAASEAAAHGKFELVGPDVVDGVACMKYKVTGEDGKSGFMWIDAAKQVPVKMSSEDGSFTVLWKNYTVGPQAATLFEPPAGYQTMSMPGMPGGAGGPPGGMDQ